MRGRSAFLFALIACSGCQAVGPRQSVPQTVTPNSSSEGNYIKHVVVIVQENRSFENFFAGYPGANAPMSGCGYPPKKEAVRRASQARSNSTPTCPKGDEVIPLRQITFQKGPNLSHEFHSGIIDWRNGSMDGFTYFGHVVHDNTAAYAYVERSQVAPYWNMAQQYVLADNMFPTEFGPSWTAHLTIVAGTDNVGPKHALADFADGRNNCNSPAGEKTTTVNKSRVVRQVSGPYPCLDQFNTIAQVLDTAAVPWKYYVGTNLKAFIWSPFAAIKYVYKGPDWNTDIIEPSTQVLKDIAAGNLASVSWVTPSKADSDHPGAHSDTGPSWVTSVVNAVGESSYWDSTAIIVLWDDWGGFYDNAPPPQLDFRGLGIRVPCLIISPYAKQGVVDHTQYEFGSVLKFIRNVFGLPAIGPTSEGYTDTRANDLNDAFDFSQSPRQFDPITSKYPAEHFLHEPPSNEPVDND
jgi:phospholipase C